MEAVAAILLVLVLVSGYHPAEEAVLKELKMVVGEEELEVPALMLVVVVAPARRAKVVPLKVFERLAVAEASCQWVAVVLS